MFYVCSYFLCLLNDKVIVLTRFPCHVNSEEVDSGDGYASSNQTELIGSTGALTLAAAGSVGAARFVVNLRAWTPASDHIREGVRAYVNILIADKGTVADVPVSAIISGSACILVRTYDQMAISSDSNGFVPVFLREVR